MLEVISGESGKMSNVREKRYTEHMYSLVEGKSYGYSLIEALAFFRQLDFES